MKRTSLFLLLFAVCSLFWTTAKAVWVLGDRLTPTQLKAGDTLILNGGAMDQTRERYMVGASLPTVISDGAPVILVAAPNDPISGDKAYYMKQLSTGLFVGTDEYQSENVKMVTTQDSALAFSVYASADSSVESRFGHVWDNDCAVFCNKTIDASTGAKNILYLCNYNEYGDPFVVMWPYSDTNQWYVYRAKQDESWATKLQYMVNDVNNAFSTCTPGVYPGYTDSTVYNKVKADLDKAQAMLLETHTDAELEAMYNQMLPDVQALKDALIAVTDGYYYFVNAYPNFAAQQNGAIKAMYAGSDKFLHWANINEKDATYIFKVTKMEDGNYKIQSLAYDTYINTASGTSVKVPLTDNFTTGQVFSPVGEGQFNIYNSANNVAYHCEGHNSGAGVSGNIVTWTAGVNSQSSWILKRIDSQELIDSLKQAAAQVVLNENLKGILENAQATYDKCFKYLSPITNANDEDPACQISSNAKEPTCTGYKALIDNNTDTYFHSMWSVVGPTDYHYLQFDVSSAPVQKFFFTTVRRMDNNSNRPTKILITATNDTTGGGTWTFIDSITSGLPVDSRINSYTSKVFDMGQAYKYVRFSVLATNNGALNNRYPFFTYSEFHFNLPEYDKTLSQYSFVPGMKDACDALKTQLDLCRQMVADGKATQDAYDKLTKDVAAVKALYSDSTTLIAKINLAQTLVDSVVVGNEMGQLTDASVIASLQAAIAAASSINRTTALKAELDKGVSDLQAACDAFVAKIKTIEPNKWYYITNTDKLRKNANQWDRVCNGNAIYAAGNNIGSSILWGFYSDGQLNCANNPYAMWRFVPIAGQEGYAVQNMATGNYLGSYTYNSPMLMSEKPAPYKVDYMSNANFVIYSLDSLNVDKVPLHAASSGSAILTWPASYNSPSTWTFKEVPADVDAVTIKYINNTIQGICLPFAVNGFSSINDGIAKSYAIKAMPNDSTLELTQKDDFASGEPFIIVVGDQTAYDAANLDTAEVVFARPDEVAPVFGSANGLIGVATSMTLKKPGLGYFAQSLFKVSTGAALKLDGHQAYIDPKQITDAGGKADLTLLTYLGGKLTAIKSVPSEMESSTNIYSTDGRLIMRGVSESQAKQMLRKGIYIIGKKKVFVQ